MIDDDISHTAAAIAIVFYDCMSNIICKPNMQWIFLSYFARNSILKIAAKPIKKTMCARSFLLASATIECLGPPKSMSWIVCVERWERAGHAWSRCIHACGWPLTASTHHTLETLGLVRACEWAIMLLSRVCVCVYVYVAVRKPNGANKPAMTINHVW